ncbi:MAG TPA: ABC transporter permease [Vicinamibacterales bacterium]|nr:ABC transporter permease [Vicinamibacterales bacterium]
MNWRNRDESVAIVPLFVTANFFDVVGVPIGRGRGFGTAEAQAERTPRLAVVSHRFWLIRLQGDAGVVGRTLTLNGQPYTITGVLKHDVRSLPGYGLAPDLYLPLSRELLPGLEEPRAAVVQLIGRLRPGQSVDQGRAAISAVASRIGVAEADPEFSTIRDFAHVGGISQVREFKEVGAFFVVLMIVSGLVLAIACANVAGLLLARGTARRREMAMRAALGASRPRLLQQLLVEGLVLTTAGTAVGVGLMALVDVVLSRVPLPFPVPLELRVRFDSRAASLALVLLVTTTLLCALAPAIRATHVALLPALREPDQRGVRRLTLRSLLVAGQVAVAVLLLAAAAVFLRNLSRASLLDPGFRVDDVLVAQLAFVEGRQGVAGRFAVEDVIARVRAVPGVQTAAFSEGVPLTVHSGWRTGTLVRLEGREGLVRVDYDGNRVGPGYFETMGIQLVRGRSFTPGDRGGAPNVAIVNEAFANRYLPGLDPLGRHLSYPDEGRLLQIVGVVSNSRYRSIGEAGNAALYEPYLQRRAPERLVHLLVRTAGPASALALTMREAVLAADGTTAVSVQPMRSALSFAMLPSRVGAALLGILGGLGTFLAMVGLFGVISFAVSRRTSEIAVRLALGASRGAIARLLLRDAGLLVGGGIAVGLVLAVFVMQPLTAFLVAGLSPIDPLSFAWTVGVLLLASSAAVWGPGRRAVRIEPATALRVE